MKFVFSPTRVLVYVYNNPWCYKTEVNKKLDLNASGSTITKIVCLLKEKGLIIKRIKGNKAHLHVTDKGEKIAKEMSRILDLMGWDKQ